MHKYIILFFLVLTILCSCSSEDSVPDGILPKDQMMDVIMEVHIVDGGLANITQMPDTLYKYGTPRYLAVFKKYHTDSAQFRRSYKYYALKPLTLNDMYVKILKKLQTKTDSVTKLLAKQNKSNHSVASGTGGRVAPGQAGPISQATPVRPTVSISQIQQQQAMIKFKAQRDSMIKHHLKEKNALPQK